MNEVKKIQKTSKIIAKVCKVFRGIFLVTFGLLLLCGIVILAEQKTMVSMMKWDTFDFKMYGSLINRLAEQGNFFGALIATLLYFMFMTVILTLLLHCLTKIFTLISENYSPFLPELTKYMRIVAVIATLITLMNSLGMGLILGLTLWAVLQIFDYGCKLQNESDETL